MRFILSTIWVLSLQAHAVVNGTAADPADKITKSVVFIAFGESNRCTGAVVGKRWVLTAAHCMEYPPQAYQIFFISDLTPALQHKVKAPYRRAVNAYRAPTFAKVDPLSDDAVLMELDGDVPAGVEIAALADPQPNLAPGTAITTYGFGLQNAEGIPFPMLPQGKMPWEPVRLMQKTLPTATPKLAKYKGIQLDYHRLFVQQRAGGICLGDSGGPVFLDGKIIGVNGATVPDFPGEGAEEDPTCAMNAYVTRVDTLATWIKSVITPAETPSI